MLAGMLQVDLKVQEHEREPKKMTSSHRAYRFDNLTSETFKILNTDIVFNYLILSFISFLFHWWEGQNRTLLIL